MIRFACPGCSATFTVTADKAGKAGKCPKCLSQFVIPAGVTAGEAAAADLAPLEPVPLTGGQRPPDPLPPPLPPDGPAPPPLPVDPPPVNPQEPVEVRPCPSCRERLSVLPADVGKDVACPKCETVFRAEPAGRNGAPPPPGGPRRSSSLERLGSGEEPTDEEDRDRKKSRWERNRDRADEDDRRPRPSRRSRYDDEDDRGRSRGGSGFRCRGCGSRARPVYKEEISTGGWVVFALMLTFCFPLFWIGLLMKEQHRACGDCGRKLT